MLDDLLLNRKNGGSLGTPLIGWNYDTDLSTGRKELIRSGALPTIIAPPTAAPSRTKALRGQDDLILKASETISLFDVTIDALVSLGTNVTGGYVYFLALLPFTNARFQLRIGDGGFGNRVTVGFNLGSTSGCWLPNVVPANLHSKWTHFRITRKADIARLYINGVKTAVANGDSGAGGSYSYREFAAPNLSAGTTGMRSGTANTNIYVAEWALYDEAAPDTSFDVPSGYFDQE